MATKVIKLMDGSDSIGVAPLSNLIFVADGSTIQPISVGESMAIPIMTNTTYRYAVVYINTSRTANSPTTRGFAVVPVTTNSYSNYPVACGGTIISVGLEFNMTTKLFNFVASSQTAYVWAISLVC